MLRGGKIIMATNKKTLPLEKDIQRKICEWLKSENIFFWRANNIPVFGMNNGGKMVHRAMPKFALKGVPDIICIQRGVFIALEVKRPGAKLRYEQEEFKERCEDAGGVYRVVHSLEELEDMNLFRVKKIQ